MKCKHENIVIWIDRDTLYQFQCSDCGLGFDEEDMKSMQFKSVEINEIIYKRLDK